MPGKKIILANILFNSNLLGLFKRLPLQNKLIVLNYHRIRTDDPGFSTVFDDDVFTISAAQFALQVKWLKQHTRLFSEKELIATLNSKEKPSLPSVFITFDDGYRDNFTLAYPILKENNVPATFFITTKLIETRQVGWWDMIAYIVKKSPLTSVAYGMQQFSLTNGRREAIDFFHQKMKVEKYEKTRHLIEDLTEIFEVEPPTADIQNQELLTWDQIKIMSEDVVTIGSHTHSHLVLSTLAPMAQKEEMVLSKLILEQKIGQEISSIAYPVGGFEHFTVESQMIARDCGYQLGFSCDTGVNSWNIKDLLAVSRVSGLLEDLRTVSAFVILPEIFMWDKAASRHQTVLKEHPDYADFSFRLGLISLGQGKIDKAIASFQDALNSNPDYVEARIKLGISQAYSRNYDAAIDNFKRVISKHPNYADVHYLLGIAYSGHNQFDAAIKSFFQTLQINPSYKDAKVKLGILYFATHDYEAGLREFEEAILLDPDDADLKIAIEVGQKNMATPPESKKELIEALNIGLFGGSDRVDQIVQEFGRHIEISPNLSDMLAIIANYSEEDDALHVLIPLFSDYVAQYPDYSDLHNIFGTLYLKLRRLAEAESCFKKAVEISPRYLKARLNLFHTLKQQSKFKEALKEGQYVASKNVPYPDFYFALGEVLWALSKNREALENAQKVLDLNPMFLKAYFLKAQIFTQLGNKSEAIKALEQILSSNPSKVMLKEAKRTLAGLKREA